MGFNITDGLYTFFVLNKKVLSSYFSINILCPIFPAHGRK